MIIKETIGIDISKLNFDVRIHSNQAFDVFENETTGFRKMLKWAYKSSNYSKNEILFVFEHTGLYSYSLASYLSQKSIPYTMISGLEIKRSLGITRGKDDKIDATKIALYGYRLRDEIKPHRMQSTDLIKLKHLLTLRERLVRQRSANKSSLTEQNRILSKKDNALIFSIQKRLILVLSKQIDKLEKEALKVIYESKDLSKIYQLAISVKGVGSQTALTLIVYTDAFTKFKNSRKFASYCGIAPFPNQSGISIRGKTQISQLANKKAKSLLDMCAKSAIQYNPEMKAYYESRVAQGKNKMSTINIIRNKILARVFAVVKRGTPYVDTMKYAA